ncbi:MAG: transcriptional repressor [Candidatus Azobacteroides sp.]|nr:transcriptional repressor [Candidatus Azobacteroides sp.]
MEKSKKVSLEEIRDMFTHKGIKVTPQRIAVYQALSGLSHPSVEEVTEEVHKTSPTITVATIYNILENFCDKEIIVKMKTTSGRMKYENHNQLHHHIYDEEKDMLEDYYDEELNQLLKEYFEKKQLPDWEILNCQLHLQGKYKTKE